MGGGGGGGRYLQTPLQARALGALVSAFTLKNSPSFPSKRVGMYATLTNLNKQYDDPECMYLYTVTYM